MSDKADIPLDFADKASIASVIESRHLRGRAALTDAIGRALGGGIGAMPQPPKENHP